MNYFNLLFFLFVCGTLASQATLPPEMVFVEGGTFTMGCTAEQQPCNSWESPTRIVRISSFELGKYEVTQAQWELIMGNGAPQPYWNNHPENPMEQASFYDYAVFCNRLSIQSNLMPCYYADEQFYSVYDQLVDDSLGVVEIFWNPQANGYRLPTEAEWEFAARGGNAATFQTLYSGSNDLESVAWHTGNNPPWGSKAIGAKLPNALGIYDLSGNVWEWIWDVYYSYSYYPNCSPTDRRCMRSGDYSDGDNSQYRVSNRGAWRPGDRHALIGFRLARNVD